MITNGPQGGDRTPHSSEHAADWGSNPDSQLELPTTARRELVNRICSYYPALRAVLPEEVSDRGGKDGLGKEEPLKLAAERAGETQISDLLPQLLHFRDDARRYVCSAVLDAGHRSVVSPDPVLSGISQINGYPELTVVFDLRVSQSGRSIAVALSPDRFGPQGTIKKDFVSETAEVNPGSVMLGISADPQMGILTERIFITPSEFANQTEIALDGDGDAARRCFFAAYVRSALACDYGERYTPEKLFLSLCGRDGNTTHFFARIPGRPTGELTFASFSLSDACELTAKVQRRAA